MEDKVQAHMYDPDLRYELGEQLDNLETERDELLYKLKDITRQIEDTSKALRLQKFVEGLPKGTWAIMWFPNGVFTNVGTPLHNYLLEVNKTVQDLLTLLNFTFPLDDKCVDMTYLLRVEPNLITFLPGARTMRYQVPTGKKRNPYETIERLETWVDGYWKAETN